jgi:hypothetical protein
MKCEKARELISLFLPPDESWLTPTNRQALEAHMAACEPCCQECRESQKAAGILRERRQIGADVAALLKRGRRQGWHAALEIVTRLIGASRCAVPWAVAAYLAVAVLGTRAFSSREAPLLGPERSVALAGADAPFGIESAGSGGIGSETAVPASRGETERLALNGRHRVVMNVGAKRSLEPLVEAGRTGCLVNLSLGEIYVHVGHDGSPPAVPAAHGRAVITGAAFDVKATEVGTTVSVAEAAGRAVGILGADARCQVRKESLDR